MTVLDYIIHEQNEDPVMMDLVTRLDGGDQAAPSTANKRQKRNPGATGGSYPEHLSLSAIQDGLRTGVYHQGAMKSSRYGPFEGRITVSSLSGGDDGGLGGAEVDIHISGRLNMNRALDGDIVVVELVSGTSDGAEGQEDDGRAFRNVDAEKAAGILADVNDADDIDDIDKTAPAAAAGRSGSLVGRVVGIIKRNWRSRGYAGSLKVTASAESKNAGRTSNTRVLFIPMDPKVPMVVMMTRQYNTLKDKRIVVKIDGWECDNDYPHGHYVRTIGVSGDRDTESSVVLFEYDINDNPFSPAVYACLPKLPWALADEKDMIIVSPEEKARMEAEGGGVGGSAGNRSNVREDLRALNVCSVDPPGCKDIDDALHCVRIEEGNGDGVDAEDEEMVDATGTDGGRRRRGRNLFEVGVHIADVTHFMKPNTALDEEAGRRCTSTYLVDRRIDMLPKALTEDICSLRANVDRLAFSVIWTIDFDTADIVDTRFTKSVIHSKAALSYVEAQTRMDDSRVLDSVTRSLRNLNSIAKKLRRKRMEKGALVLASPEVKFQLDTETHDPTDVGVYEIREANQMVEEFMLLANISVAQKILDSFPASSVLRRHPAPTQKMLGPLVASLKSIGIDTGGMDASDSKSLNACLDGCVRESDDYFNKLVRIIATRCMTQAQYFSSGDFIRSEFKHYGLAMAIYTHFTSPIRRFADDIVHRLLAAAIGIDSTPDIVTDEQGLRDQVQNLNYRHRNAQMAGRASAELHTVLFFRNKPTVATARIIRVRKNGMVVFVPQYGIEGPIVLAPSSRTETGLEGLMAHKGKGASASAPIAFESDEERQILRITGANQRTFRLFDKCDVRIRVEEGQVCRRLELSLVL